MSDPNSSSDLLSYVLSACVVGISWLFKTVFNHNKEMVSQIVALQKDTAKTQLLTKDALIKMHTTIEDVKTELTTNSAIQKEILQTLQSQHAVLADPRKIIVSQASGQHVPSKSKLNTTLKRKHRKSVDSSISQEHEEVI